MPLRVPYKARVWKTYTQPMLDISLMEISESNGLIDRIITPEKFGNDCRNLQTVESKVAHTTGLAKPATRADHS